MLTPFISSALLPFTPRILPLALPLIPTFARSHHLPRPQFCSPPLPTPHRPNRHTNQHRIHRRNNRKCPPGIHAATQWKNRRGAARGHEAADEIDGRGRGRGLLAVQIDEQGVGSVEGGGDAEADEEEGGFGAGDVCGVGKLVSRLRKNACLKDE